MKILSITAQKPNSTGSGIYLMELVKGFHKAHAEQVVVAGVYREDNVQLPEGVEFTPVYFKEGLLSFPIPGMSDEMPYESTVYGQMTPQMAEAFEQAFCETIERVCEKFCPDIIVCHHLYLLTASVREKLQGYKVIGISHGTDLRQMKKIELNNYYIKEQIQKLDLIFALQNEQKKEVTRIYGVTEEKIKVIGVGYNSDIFHPSSHEKPDAPIRIVFAGKIAEKKGVISLLNSVSRLSGGRDSIELTLCGGYGNQAEYDEICALAKNAPCRVIMPGKLSQEHLAEVFGSSHIFILPSFYEGLPLVLLEALACGTQVICTDLPGIQPWLDEVLPDHGIHFVRPPRMQNTDEPVKGDLPEFENRLTMAIEECINKRTMPPKGIADRSWDQITANVLEYIEEIYRQ